MRTQIIILILFFTAGNGGLASAQQWEGASGTTDGIYRQGAVGVGVEVPDRLFHVNGDAVKFERSGSDAGLLLDLNESDGTHLREWHLLVDNPTGNFFLRDATSPSNATRFLVDTEGRVGVGTEDPAGELHVYNPSDISLSKNGGVVLGDVGGQNIAVDNNEIISREGGSESTLHLQAEGGRVKVHTNQGNGSEFVIQDGGDVGIGTVFPSTKLAVNGTTRTKEVIVETENWPDYVFDENYDLRSPAELATFIEQKGHLPALPAAEEVEREGQTVGTVQRGLVQTVEELARYAIEQRRRVRRRQMEALQRRMEELKRRLDRQDDR